MNEASSASASSTGTTPDSAAKNTRNLTEAEYLQQRAEEARKAISQTFSLIGKNLGQAANPKALTDSHPWLAVAGAAVGGFVAVTALVPSKEKRLLRKLAAIERAVAPQPVVATDGTHRSVASSNGGIMSKVMNELIKSIQPALMGALTAGIGAKVTQEKVQENQQEEEMEEHVGASVPIDPPVAVTPPPTPPTPTPGPTRVVTSETSF